MNFLVFVLWVLVILSLILSVYVTTLNVDKVTTTRKIVIMNAKNICTVASDKLYSITDNMCCRNGLGGTVTANRLIDLPTDNGTITMVVNPVSKEYYLDVCSGYCTLGLRSGTSVPTCNYNPDSQNDDQKLQSCIAATRPINCQGLSMPIARVGGQSYYISSAGADSCPSQTVCSGA